MKQNESQNKCLAMVLMLLTITVASFAQASEGDEPVKVSYRKSYEWFDASYNLPCRSIYIVYKDMTYADGRTETQSYPHPYTYMAGVSANFSCYYNNRWTKANDVYYNINDSTRIYYGPEIQDADNAFAHNNITDGGGGLITVKYTQTGVPDLSLLKWELLDETDNFKSRDLTDYTSSIYAVQGKPLHYDPQNPVEGWYIDKRWGHRYLMLYYDHTLFKKLHYDWFFYDRILYLDGQLFDFAGFKPTIDYDLRVTDKTMPDGSPAKEFYFECKMKYLDHDYYAAVVETVYQLPQ